MFAGPDPVRQMILVAPSCTYYAFSLELYFKCLSTIHSGIVKHDHDLVKLFKEIAPDTQRRIKEVFAERSAQDDPRDRELETALSAATGGLNHEDFDALLA